MKPEEDTGRCDDPNVWMRHPITAANGS